MGTAEQDKQMIKERMAEDVVVQKTRQGYIPQRRVLLASAFTGEQALNGVATTSVSRNKVCEYQVPTGEKLIFAPYRRHEVSGYFWASVSGTAVFTGTTTTYKDRYTISAEVQDPRKQRTYGVVVQASSKVLNGAVATAGDKEMRQYFINAKPILAEEGDYIVIYVEGKYVSTLGASPITNGYLDFGFELWELIRAK